MQKAKVKNLSNNLEVFGFDLNFCLLTFNF